MLKALQHFTSLALLIAPAVAGPLQGPKADAEKISVLVVSGQNNHDWKWTSPSLASILEESGRFDVEVTYEPNVDLANAEKLSGVQAVVLDYNGDRWGEAAETTFLAAVTEGLGVVVIHAADNNGNGWQEYERLVGDLWRQGTGHGSFHPFDVEVTDREHPITRSLPTILKHPDELYHNLVNVHGVDRRVLATAFSDKETGGTGEDEPMVIVRDYGKGRIFHTPLGHVWVNSPASQASHRDPQFRGLVVRGTEWAATGRVRDNRRVGPANGWESLMDPTLWRAFGGGAVPKGWSFRGDTIVRTASSGDIVTESVYGDFELRFEWKTTIAGNSGLKYRVPAFANQPIAPEFQLLDHWNETENPEHRAGALYDVIAAKPMEPGTWGDFHEARIVSEGPKIEHWLDGVLVASADTSSPEWAEAVASSKFKDHAGFGEAGPGRILLQDHGDEVWIQNMRIRPILKGPGRPSPLDVATPLFPGKNIAAWSRVGDAGYEIEGNTLIGSAGPKRLQSFLVSKEEFGNFTLDVDLQIEVLGNSGIQIRSHVNDKGRLFGYQAEIDPTDRSWSGGIYDEGRRGWINDLSKNEAARKAFDREGWNHYRIVCEGPRIRTWVNDVPAADLLDGLDLTGSIGFQVHGGDDDIRMRWKDATITRSSIRHEWQAIERDSGDQRHTFGDEVGVLVRVRGDMPELWFEGEKPAQTLKDVVGVANLSDTKYWMEDGLNDVHVLRAADRIVVQVNGRTLLDQAMPGVTGFSVYQVLTDCLTERWERCVEIQR